jgi:hypothetical protein
MSNGFVQSAQNITGQSGTTATITFTANLTAGNASFAHVFWKNTVTITSAVDSAGNSYLDCGAGRLTRPVDGFMQVLGAKNIAAGTTPTITITFSSAAASVDLYCSEYSGADTTTLFGGFATGTATSGTAVTTGTITPGVTDGAVLAFAVSQAGTGTAGTNFTARQAPADWAEIIEDWIFTSSIGTPTASANFSTTITKAGIIACVIRAAAGGGGGNANLLVGKFGALLKGKLS